MTSLKRVLIIAGPNGAGKTTFATEFLISRVKKRVLEGGHDVPESVICRRFLAGWRNFESIYRGLVDEWAVFDNSGSTPVLLAER